MYAVYHGPQGLRDIAADVHAKTMVLANALKKLDVSLENDSFFDTLTIGVPYNAKLLIKEAEALSVNFRFINESMVGISLDETVSHKDLLDIIDIFLKSSTYVKQRGHQIEEEEVQIAPGTQYTSQELLEEVLRNMDVSESGFPPHLARKSEFLTHEVFNSYHSETELLRYITDLQNKVCCYF